MIKKIFILSFVCFAACCVWGIEIKFIDKIRLSQEDSLLAFPCSLFVTEDNKIFVTDFKMANFKIYSKKGKIIKVWGRKGHGPDEFLMPLYTDYYDSHFAVLDSKKRKVFVYKRKGNEGLQFEKKMEFICIASGSDISLTDNEILVAGFKSDKNGNSYELYSKNRNNGEFRFIMPAAVKYGLDSLSEKEFLKEYRNNNEYVTIGLNGYIDWSGANVYYVWEGNLRIINSNLNTGKISFFGKQTGSYIKPKPSKKMIKAYKEMDMKIHPEERKKLTYVNKIFSNNDFAAISFTKPIKNYSAYNLFIQFYTTGGKFLQEINLNEVKVPPILYFMKKNNSLYLLSYEEDKDLNIEYVISEYKITL